MGHKEYTVIAIVDILRRWLGGDGIRRIASSTGIDQNTVRKYIRIAEEKGISIDFKGDLDEIASLIFSEVHPQRNSEKERDLILLPHKQIISDWLEKKRLTLTKVHIKLTRLGVDVSYSALYRFSQEHLGFSDKYITVHMSETKPGEVAEVDFGRLGIIYDPTSGRNRVLYALVITLVFSRHQYVYTTHSRLEELDLVNRGGLGVFWRGYTSAHPR